MLGARDGERRARGLRRGDPEGQLLVVREPDDGRLIHVLPFEVEVAEGERETVVLRAFIFTGITIMVRIISVIIVTHVPILR